MTWNEDQMVADLAAATNRTVEEARETLRRALADIDDWEHKVLTVKADERLIFKFDTYLTGEDADRIKHLIKAALGDDLRFIVIGEGIDVDIIKQEETA